MTIAQVVWLTGPGAIEIRDEALPSLGLGELSCETIVTAISPGTELAAYTGQPPLRPSVAYPRLQGYCNVARIIESRADGFEPGDRVLSFMSHRSHFTLPASDVLYRLPAGASSGHIACAYLYHLGYNAVLRSEVKLGSRVLVIGLGVLGLTTVAMASLAGATVYVLSDQPEPTRLATAMGARAVFRRDQQPELQSTLGAGADVVISTVNGWNDWSSALRLAGQNAHIACLGFPGRGQEIPKINPLDSQFFYMKQLRIEAVGWSPEQDDSRGFLRFNERANLAWIASLIESCRIAPDLLISGTYPAHQIGAAYDALLARTGSPLTFLLEWNK